MSRRLFSHLCLVAVSIGGAVGAQGLEPSRVYLKGFGGAEFPEGFDGSELARTGHGPEDVSFRFDYDTGSVIGAAIGYFTSPRVVVELEYAYRRAHATVTGLTTEIGDEPVSDEFSFHERVAVQSGMVNAFYRFEGVGPQGKATPYLGAGVGVARLDVRGTGRPDPAFAWQAIGGAAYAVNDHWSLVGEVRWFSAEGGTFIDSVEGADLVQPVERGFDAFDVIVGASYRF
jgi:opacity protein-like surface antigen